MALNRFDGLDLPEFNPERPLLVGKSAYKQASRDQEQTFLRFVRHSGQSHQSVQQRINIAKKEFNRLSDYLGVKVVNCTYGLYPITEDAHRGFQSPMVPEGFILAAEVDVVYRTKDLNPLSPSYFRLCRDIVRYSNDDGRLSDIHPDDVISASLQPEAGAPRERIFTDIEPMVK